MFSPGSLFEFHEAVIEYFCNLIADALNDEVGDDGLALPIVLG